MCGDPGAFCLHGLSVYVGTRVFVDRSGKKKKKKGTLLYSVHVVYEALKEQDAGRRRRFPFQSGC